MIKKILKRMKIVSIDMLFYSMDASEFKQFNELDFIIQTDVSNPNKTKYFIEIDSRKIHESTLFKKIDILKLIQKKGPAIGECVTIPEFKGKSIYPFVINYIAKKELFENQTKEVFIIVDANNISSIKGIEKAGFTLKSSVKAKRFLWFYFKRRIKNFK
jgi:RimJ/RimL family protein N-acetyltransferase